MEPVGTRSECEVNLLTNRHRIGIRAPKPDRLPAQARRCVTHRSSRKRSSSTLSPGPPVHGLSPMSTSTSGRSSEFARGDDLRRPLRNVDTPPRNCSRISQASSPIASAASMASWGSSSAYASTLNPASSTSAGGKPPATVTAIMPGSRLPGVRGRDQVAHG